MTIARKIARNLLMKGAVQVKIDPPFTWASGIKSPVYCDNRKMIAHPKERKLVVDAFKDMIKKQKLQFDVIGGTATAAIPWAAFLAYELDLPMIYIRPEPKGHGAGKQIEGDLQAGQRVLIVEDLVSTGGSSIKAAEAVRGEGGAIVENIFAIVSWEMPGVEKKFKEAGLKLSTLTDYSSLIPAAVEHNFIPGDQLGMVMQFKEDPQSWWERVKRA